MTYQAPVDDIMHALKSAGGLDDLLEQNLFDDLDAGTVGAIIEEAGRFGSEILDPLNREGDRLGSTLNNGKVATPPGWSEAYRQFTSGGWSSLPGPVEYGGQGLPEIVSMAVSEIWNATNLSFGLCPLLTQGAIGALQAGGSEELKATYLSRLVSGEWSGTMNLTEPQAGSDLSTLKTRAVPQEDGTYRIFGTKIFITYGEHELCENIIHLVLARLPDAPAGTRGISLFLVPKFLVNSDGSLGERNDLTCTGLEEKLGIHASPTCVMTFGERDGAVGYLVGEENRGLNTMFIMMNAARLAVGVQGVAIAERATQRATAYASERRQGRAPAASAGASHETVPIIAHPDVRRMILTMKAMTQAARAICLATAREIDISQRAPSAADREQAAARAALLTPVAKAFSTDVGCEVSSLGVQVHGGMGFIEETGAAQYYRDARILPIYEGTNGIQAIDLVIRKLPLADGDVLKSYLTGLRQTVEKLTASNRPEFGATAKRLGDAVDALAEVSGWIGHLLSSNPQRALAGATPYLRLFGITAGGCYLAGGAIHALMNDDPQKDLRIGIARFFAEQVATAAPGLAVTVTTGSDAILDLDPETLRA